MVLDLVFLLEFQSPLFLHPFTKPRQRTLRPRTRLFIRPRQPIARHRRSMLPLLRFTLAMAARGARLIMALTRIEEVGEGMLDGAITTVAGIIKTRLTRIIRKAETYVSAFYLG